MQKMLLDRRSTSYFSAISNTFLYEPQRFAAWECHAASPADFAEAIAHKKNFAPEHRIVLQRVLQQAYHGHVLAPKQAEHLTHLTDPDTYTVCTGHQLSLFGGPAYFLYKIMHAIRLAEALNAHDPNHRIVPVFWMASEDHDFEEIKSFYLFRQQITWESEQSGPTGRMLLHEWDSLKKSISELFVNHPESEVHALLEAYSGRTLGEATFALVNHLFGNYGVLVLDADQPELKQLFAPIMQRELSQPFADAANQHGVTNLAAVGFEPQAMSRPINLFYLGEQSRERLIPENGQIRIESRGLLEVAELVAEIESHPERFSPNVILRPVYQECILPNLCYIGGGGEIAYWLQLPKVFHEAGIPYPKLQIRNSIQVMDTNSIQKAEKLGLSLADLFRSPDDLKQNYLQRHNTDPVDFTLMDQKLAELSTTINQLITSVDPQLKTYAEAEQTRLNNQVESIRQKLLKADRNRFDQALKQIEGLKSKLFPANGLQERQDHFLNFCPDGNYRSWMQDVLQQMDPFEADLLVIH